jgi:hypothetical protein
MECGLSIQILANRSDRSRLLRKIVWLQQNQDHDVPDVRTYKRIIPQDPISTLIFPDATVTRCFIIDMSASGAAVSADIYAEIGTVLAVGTVPSKVVRHFRNEFAVKFYQLQEHQSLEQLVILSSSWRRRSNFSGAFRVGALHHQSVEAPHIGF